MRVALPFCVSTGRLFARMWKGDMVTLDACQGGIRITYDADLDKLSDLAGATISSSRFGGTPFVRKEAWLQSEADV